MIGRKLMVTNILSQTSKMPCKSISLDAELCNTGSKLAKIPNTPCNKCYALRGFYNMPSVKKAMAARLEFMTGEHFVERMILSLSLITLLGVFNGVHLKNIIYGVRY